MLKLKLLPIRTILSTSNTLPKEVDLVSWVTDRGYLSGRRISDYKKNYRVDTLVPLKCNMENFKDALVIAERKNKWVLSEQEKNKEGQLLKETYTCLIENMNLWGVCSVELNVYVSKTKRWSQSKQNYEEYFWCLASTKKYSSEKAAVERYGLRFKVEERFWQLKCSWDISKFPSPSRGLMESHICFTLLTYSFLQLYLRRKDLRSLTQKTIETLQREEQLGKNVILIYAGKSFGVMNLEDYSVTLIEMEESAKKKLKLLMQSQKESS